MEVSHFILQYILDKIIEIEKGQSKSLTLHLNLRG